MFVNRERTTARRATAVLATSAAALLTASGLAFAADLKSDLSLVDNGIQQNQNLGNVVGGSTITFTNNLSMQGGPPTLTSATVDDDGNLPVWVTAVTGGVVTKSPATDPITTSSTITVVAPCTLGEFGAEGDDKVAGASVQYAVIAVNSGASISSVETDTAWVNIRGNVTSLGPDCDTTPSDTTAPTGASVVIDDGAAWTNGNGAVSLDLAADDNVGIVKYRLAETQAGLDTATDVAVTPAASFSATDVPFTLTGAEASDKRVWARFYDAAGGSAETFDSIGWDMTGPVITDDSSTTPPSGEAGLNGWYTSEVTVTFRASDNVSGFVGEDNPYTFTRTTADGVEGSAVTVASGTVDDVAGNTSNSVTSQAFKIDLNDPTVTCGATPSFVLNSSGNVVSASVTDTLTGSGPAAATVTAVADTSSIGAHSATVTGYDNAGRSQSVECSYHVIYAWTGFFRPIDNLPMVNSVKAGSAIPVKFDLGGNQGLDIFGTGSPSSQKIVCDTGATVDAVETTVTAGSSTLSYDPLADQYTYVWKTDKAWANTCRQLTVTLDDGTTHVASFKFMK